MKQKVLLLMVLALVACSITGIAQEKEYQVGNDGYEWYKIKHTVNGQTKYGAEDRNGNMIVPIEYDGVSYIPDDNPLCTGFLAVKDGGVGWYNKSGKCVIPYSRGYDAVIKLDKDDFGTYYKFEKPDGEGICDRNGREVLSVKVEGLLYFDIYSHTINGTKRYYLELSVNKNGESFYAIADTNGKIVVPAEYKESSTALNLAKSHLTTRNPLANNRHETLAEAEGRPQGGQSNPIAGQQQQDGGNAPVVVEHHRDQIPVQEWQQCPACYGSGQCPYVKCGGSGWYYIGDRVTTCSRCHGSGKCTICAGRGGQNVTVYRSSWCYDLKRFTTPKCIK